MMGMMMGYKLGIKSKLKLRGVNPDLVKVVTRAIELSEIDFTVLEGLRTIERQKQLVNSGASKTMKSRHLTGHAIDIAPIVNGSIRWDWPLYLHLAEAMKKASNDCNIPIRWGGTWKLLSLSPDVITSKDINSSFPDGPHFELPIAVYPA